jgi:phosphatidate cytidylyltransferase
MLSLTLASTWTTVLMCSALAGFCAFEFYAMLRSDAKLPNEMIGILSAIGCPPVFFLFHFNGLLTLTLVSATILLVWYVFDAPARITDVAITLFGFCYTGMMLSSLVSIREALPGFWGGVLVAAVMVSVWFNDAVAYWIGSRFGAHKLAPRISPNKSWEGFIAGIVGSIAVWCLMTFIPGFDLEIGWAVLGGVICGLFGILGDLVESRIKRATGHKDSGKLLPGHGGFLDRCDSMLTVAVVAMLYFRLFGIL